MYYTILLLIQYGTSCATASDWHEIESSVVLTSNRLFVNVMFVRVFEHGYSFPCLSFATPILRMKDRTAKVLVQQAVDHFGVLGLLRMMRDHLSVGVLPHCLHTTTRVSNIPTALSGRMHSLARRKSPARARRERRFLSKPMHRSECA